MSLLFIVFVIYCFCYLSAHSLANDQSTYPINPPSQKPSIRHPFEINCETHPLTHPYLPLNLPLPSFITTPFSLQPPHHSPSLLPLRPPIRLLTSVDPWRTPLSTEISPHHSPSLLPLRPLIRLLTSVDPWRTPLSTEILSVARLWPVRVKVLFSIKSCVKIRVHQV